ncbi:hypothetical protein GCM10025862_30160 [Arsenicicoccus piscis]|uniref:Uncharacterized protein n=1 Tax=Arsenicicoccus piscis TaxID=673954 RepID=A0ABQ6HRA6_9MICO|nr:hypothetical protein GCM10025862_30160 [Arsenicicoccus piscis]
MTTTGSNTLKVRVTAVWSAVTGSAAAGTGSCARCGAEPCPPRPRRVTKNPSEAASIGPGLVTNVPNGSIALKTCIPYAASTRRPAASSTPPRRQRVQVRAQQHHRPVAGRTSRAIRSTRTARPTGTAAQHRRDRGGAGAGAGLEGEAVEGGEHLLLGARQVQTDLRLLVHRAAERAQVVVQLVVVVEQGHDGPSSRSGDDATLARPGSAGTPGLPLP